MFVKLCKDCKVLLFSRLSPSFTRFPRGLKGDLDIVGMEFIQS